HDAGHHWAGVHVGDSRGWHSHRSALPEPHQLIITTPPLTSAIPSPLSCAIGALTVAWAVPSIETVGAEILIDEGVILMLLAPTFSSIDWAASMLHCPAFTLIVWLPVFTVSESLPVSTLTARLPVFTVSVSLPVLISTVRLPVFTVYES